MLNNKPLYNYFRNNRRSVVDVNNDVIFKLTTLIKPHSNTRGDKVWQKIVEVQDSRSKLDVSFIFERTEVELNILSAFNAEILEWYCNVLLQYLCLWRRYITVFHDNFFHGNLMDKNNYKTINILPFERFIKTTINKFFVIVIGLYFVLVFTLDKL